MPDANVMSELAIYRAGKLIVVFCYKSCKVLTAEWYVHHMGNNWTLVTMWFIWTFPVVVKVKIEYVEYQTYV